jgi:hypothetical protein
MSKTFSATYYKSLISSITKHMPCIGKSLKWSCKEILKKGSLTLEELHKGTYLVSNKTNCNQNFDKKRKIFQKLSNF